MAGHRSRAFRRAWRLIYRDPGRHRLEGGPGNDRLVGTQGATVAVTGSGSNSDDVA